MSREKIIEAIATASELRHRDGREIFASRIYSMIEAGKVPGVKFASADVQQLMKENQAMRRAIAFSISPGLWIQREEDIFQYTGKVWYGDLLKQAICRENTDEQ